VLVLLGVAAPASCLAQETTDLPAYIRLHYTKQEMQIPMRDGVKLFTAVFTPKDTTAKHPILIKRTPYSVAPYGVDKYPATLGPSEHFAKAGLAFQYVPIDISESAMGELVNSLEKLIPQLQVNGLVTDYFNGLKWLNHRYRRKNLVLFLGSSIGNFTHRGACFFLRNLWNCLNHDDSVMIGFDMKKDIDLLLRAYNDSEGVTREFNLNLLHRINRELGGRFDAGKFRYFGTYNVFSGAMESYLVSQERQTVFIEAIGRSFLFEPWEPLHTEYSYKYLASDIDQLAEETGFEVHEHIYDSKSYFVDSIWRVQKPGNAELLARELRMTAKAG
jgi:uncharacterized SAM-dependent methyltransferase